MSDSPHYTPGSESELERLQLPARCLEGLTRQLIRESGIRAGMRVLDLGSGPGDVAFLLCRGGRRVGIRRWRRPGGALGRSRAAAGGGGRIWQRRVRGRRRRFPARRRALRCGDRAVRPDPSARPGDDDPPGGGRRPAGRRGRLSGARASPRWSLPAGSRTRARGGRKFEALHAGGAAEPRRRRPDDILLHGGGAARTEGLWESVVPGSKDDVWLRSFVLTYKTLLPTMQKFGTVDPRVGDPETLAERIIAEASAKRAQSVTGPLAAPGRSRGSVRCYPCNAGYPRSRWQTALSAQ